MGGWFYHWSCDEYTHTAHRVSSCVSAEEEGNILKVQARMHVITMQFVCTLNCLYCQLSCRYFKTGQKRSASLTDTYTNNTHSNTPQPYNEAQLGQPEYATCASESQVKDDVVDNAVLYSMCGDIQLQHNVAYSKLNKK